MKMQIVYILGLSVVWIALTSPQPKANPDIWPSEDWPDLRLEDYGTYEELCEYDDLCSTLTDHNGQFKVPHPLILKLFWLQRKKLASIAKKYGIHPLIPMAAIATEHSINVGIEDQIQDNLQFTAVDINGRLLGLRAVSYGYGQLYTNEAMQAEIIVARLESRLPYDYYEYVQKRTTSIEGAYEYVAALMLYYTEAYAKAGMDISHKPGILTTLYNIGRVDERIERTVREGREPKVNYFGWFVSHNWEAFESVYNNENFNLEYVADFEQSLQERGNDGGIGNFFGSLKRHQVPTFATTVEIPLRDSLPQCDISDRTLFNTKEGLERRERIYLESIQNSQRHPYKAQGSFDIYSKGFDCLGRVWGLLNFSESGRMGWFNLESGGVAIEMINRPRQCEQMSVQAQCIEEVKGLLDSPDDFLDYNEEKHIAYVRLGHNSLLETNEINWQSWRRYIWNRYTYKKTYLCEPYYLEQLQEAPTEYPHLTTMEAVLKYNKKMREQLGDPETNRRARVSSLIGEATRERVYDGPFVHILTDNEKQELTPIIIQAVKRLESEIVPQPPTYPEVPIISQGRDSYDYFSMYWSQNPEDFQLLYQYVSWGYKYMYYCLAENTMCMLSVPVRYLIDFGNDIIDNGFRAHILEESSFKKTPKLIYHLVEDEYRDRDDMKTYQEMVEYLEPQFARMRKLSTGFNDILLGRIYNLHYEAIEYTNFSLLELYRDSQLDVWGHKLDIISSYIDGEPVGTPPPTNCNIFPEASTFYSVNDLGKAIPCEHFHRFSWSRPQLRAMASFTIRKITQAFWRKHDAIKAEVNRNRVPETGRQIYYKNSTERIWIEDVESVLIACNHNYEKTIDTLKRLSQSSCVDEFLLPADKVLNGKSREAGVHFNTIHFGEHTDRMGIKLKSTCE